MLCELSLEFHFLVLFLLFTPLLHFLRKSRMLWVYARVCFSLEIVCDEPAVVQWDGHRLLDMLDMGIWRRVIVCLYFLAIYTTVNEFFRLRGHSFCALRAEENETAVVAVTFCSCCDCVMWESVQKNKLTGDESDSKERKKEQKAHQNSYSLTTTMMRAGRNDSCV